MSCVSDTPPEVMAAVGAMMQQLHLISAAGSADERDAQYDVLANMLAQAVSAPPLPRLPAPPAPLNFEESLRATLDVLRHDLHNPRSPLPQLAERLRTACRSLASMEQEAALEMAKEAAVSTADTFVLLRRAAIEDPDEELGIAALVGTLTATLSGYGEHTTTFVAGDAVRLRLHVRPQAAGTATRVWSAARLAAWVCETRWGGFDVRGQRVLELGCGTAAAGLACAALGAKEVWLTDNEPAALDLAQRNAELNGLAARTRIAHFDLMMPDATLVASCGAQAAATPSAEAFGCFGCLIASDVLYDVTAPAQLAATLARLLLARRGEGDGAAAAPAPRALVVSSRDPTRSEIAQRAVNGFAELCASHPELRVLAELTSTEGVPEGHGDVLVLLLEARRHDPDLSNNRARSEMG